MPESPARPTRVIALMNQKGGVGKTTTTVNLAAALARAGRSTLVVDLDPQAHATLHLGADPGADAPSVYEALVDDGAPAAGAIISTRDHLALLPARTDLAAAESELAALPDRQRRLERALGPVLSRYEFVLIDCPPSLGLLTINALSLAREVIIPMQAHFLALQGVGKLLETVNLVGRAVNPRLRVTGVVLCMHDTASSHVKEVVGDLESFFEDARKNESPWRFARVLRPPIRRNIKLAECPSFGKTIFEYWPLATGAEDYTALAEVLLKEWDALLARRAGSPEGVPEIRVVAGAKPLAQRSHALTAPGDTPRRGWTLLSLLFWTYAALLFTGTHWPQLRIDGPVPRTDLWIHLGAFGLWMTLAILCGWFGTPLSGRNVGRTLAVGVIYAAFDEALQLIPALGRTAAWDDYATNLVGLSLAAGGMWTLGRILGRSGEPAPSEPEARTER